MVRVRIWVGQTTLARAIKTQIYCARGLEDTQTLPCFAGADLAYPEILSMGVWVKGVSSITKCVTLTIADSDERFAAQIRRYMGPGRSTGWSRAGTAWGLVTSCYKLSAGEGFLHLQSSQIWDVLASETSADPGMTESIAKGWHGINEATPVPFVHVVE